MNFHAKQKMSELELWQNIFGATAEVPAEELPDDAKVALRLVLMSLTPREARVLRLHYGIDTAALPLNLIARSLRSLVDPRRTITNTRAHQIHDKALRKLRHRSRLKMLIPSALEIGIPLNDYHRGLVLSLPPVQSLNYDPSRLQVAATREEAQ